MCGVLFASGRILYSFRGPKPIFGILNSALVVISIIHSLFTGLGGVVIYKIYLKQTPKSVRYDWISSKLKNIKTHFSVVGAPFWFLDTHSLVHLIRVKSRPLFLMLSFTDRPLISSAITHGPERTLSIFVLIRALW